MKTQKQRMIDGELYKVDEILKNDIYNTRRKLRDFNNSISREEIQTKAKKLFGNFGKDSTVTPPFRCDYGYNIHIGDRVYLNYNTSIIDVSPVYIADNVMIGPDCGFYTASHPIDAEVRNTNIEYGNPITIEENVWIGGNVTIVGGVTIGEGSIIGAGSVVTKDIPANVIAAGNPCKIIREIREDDHKYWLSQYNEYIEENK
ncbi:sugar O-acetyltransferase [uncultured Anaerococcus sp.]|uniref:sugar O-acetyltransferase n=1 Tax=uncultured Anaerococcus sp. TaxID=293428 RepID=UPI002605EE6F|nr:sugar O-acetyltransferase [uncultured Anaerococcus sp.]